MLFCPAHQSNFIEKKNTGINHLVAALSAGADVSGHLHLSSPGVHYWAFNAVVLHAPEARHTPPNHARLYRCTSVRFRLIPGEHKPAHAEFIQEASKESHSDHWKICAPNKPPSSFEEVTCLMAIPDLPFTRQSCHPDVLDVVTTGASDSNTDKMVILFYVGRGVLSLESLAHFRMVTNKERELKRVWTRLVKAASVKVHVQSFEHFSLLWKLLAFVSQESASKVAFPNRNASTEDSIRRNEHNERPSSFPSALAVQQTRDKIQSSWSVATKRLSCSMRLISLQCHLLIIMLRLVNTVRFSRSFQVLEDPLITMAHNSFTNYRPNAALRKFFLHWAVIQHREIACFFCCVQNRCQNGMWPFMVRCRLNV